MPPHPSRRDGTRKIRRFLLLAAQQTAKQARSVVKTNPIAQVNGSIKDSIHLPRNRRRQFLFDEIQNHFHCLFSFVGGDSHLFGDQPRNFRFNTCHFVFSFSMIM